MRISEYVSLLERALPKGKTLLSVGPPGVGKTQGRMNVCKSLGYDYIGLCSALEDPSTIRGYPSRGTNGTAEHCLFDGIARAMVATKPTCLCFEDLGMASESTSKSILRFVQFREIDNRRLPDHVVISADSNDIGQGSGVMGLIEPLKDRFDTIVQVEPHIDDTSVYGLARNWPIGLIAYLKNSPDALHDWKPEKSLKSGGATPRGWEKVAEWLNDGFDDPEIIGGKVGKGRATQLLTFLELINQLPDIDGCLLDPEGAPVPENPSARFLVSVAMSSKISNKTFGSALKYLNRLPAMFRAFSIRDAFRAEHQRKKDGSLPKNHVPLTASRDFSAWAVSEDGKAVMSAAS